MKHTPKGWEEEFNKKFTYGGITGTVALNTEDAPAVRFFIKSLLSAERERVIRLVEKEVIGEDEKIIIDKDLPMNVNDDLNEGGISRNGLRDYQRRVLKELTKV